MLTGSILKRKETAISADHPEQSRDPAANGPADPAASETAGADDRKQNSDNGHETTRSETAPTGQTSSSQSFKAATALISAVRHDISIAARKAAEKLRSVRKQLASNSEAVEAKHDPETAANRTGPLAISLAALRAGARRLAQWRPSKPGSWRLGSWKRILVAALLVGLVSFAAIFTWALKDVPWSEIANGSRKPIITLETADGGPLVRQGPYQGAYARYDQFPPQLIDAVLSIEDRRFMDHFGIDPQGIARAFLRNIQAGSVVQGGSTITQQLIKLQYLRSDRTIKRKIQELVIAFWLEWKLGKQEILTRYLNSVYLGAGATGMPAAARIYFNKDIGALNLPESALLAGLLRAPSQWNPIDNFEGARQRTAVVLDTMVENGKITRPQADSAKAGFAKLHPTKPTPRSGSWFADWISPQASEIAGDSPGSTTVRTTLVPRYQQIAERVIENALDREGKAAGASQAALVAMTPDGAVVAMVGGRDYKASQFNRAATAMRQPGSTFKLFVYYAALKAGLTLSDRVLDAPMEINGWSPENSGGGYHGWVTLAEAFARSLNAASVALAQEVGVDNVIAAARELGINAPLTANPALALGASEVNLLDLTAAYASVRYGKAPVEPWGIIEFRGAGEPKAFRVGQQSQPTVDVSLYQSDLLGLLQMVVERGTGHDADPGTFAAGKTGTSQNNRDAWFVGFTDPLVAGVWVGNDDDTPMKGVTGGSLPARIWRDFMREAMAEPAPDVDSQTGILTESQGASQSCNINACSRAYRSFRASDCTYQPYGGERQICER